VEAPDVLVASSLIIGALALAIPFYNDFAYIYASYQRGQSCFFDALRISDFLIQDPDGLATANGPLVADHVVDCTKLSSAYSFLKSKGFSVRISCGSLSVGPGVDYDARVVRYAYWPGHGVVKVVVDTCPSKNS
jgi:hypothetical protein